MDLVPSQTLRSRLLKDRGDGYRGSAAVRPGEGRLAVTHVERLESLGLATLVACRLETGRTHQIRIHLAEAGHPLLGDAVYGMDFRGVRLPAPRLMLHAAELGFAHPSDEHPMFFEIRPPQTSRKCCITCVPRSRGNERIRCVAPIVLPEPASRFPQRRACRLSTIARPVPVPSCA